MNIQKINSGTKLSRISKNTSELHQEVAGTMQMLERNQINALESLVFKLLKELESMSVLRNNIEEGIRGGKFSLDNEVERFEIGLIRSALIQTGGVQRKAAEFLGIKSTTLNVKIKRYKIDLNNFK